MQKLQKSSSGFGSFQTMQQLSLNCKLSKSKHARHQAWDRHNDSVIHEKALPLNMQKNYSCYYGPDWKKGGYLKINQ